MMWKRDDVMNQPRVLLWVAYLSIRTKEVTLYKTWSDEILISDIVLGQVD